MMISRFNILDIVSSPVRVSLSGRRRAHVMLERGGVTDVIMDVDGVLTSGLQLIMPDGQKIKPFGLDDFAAIEHWCDKVSIGLVTSDMCAATVMRAKSWGVQLTEAPANSVKRARIIADLVADLQRTVYIGDGYHDGAVMKCVGFGIAPRDAWPRTARTADGVTRLPAGRRAVAQALDFIGANLLV